MGSMIKRGLLVSLPSALENGKPGELAFTNAPVSICGAVGVLQVNVFEHVACRFNVINDVRSAEPAMHVVGVPGVNRGPDAVGSKCFDQADAPRGVDILNIFENDGNPPCLRPF